MKLVSFGDVHMATRNLERMGNELRDTDLIIISGDLTNFGGPDDARKVLDAARGACGHRAHLGVLALDRAVLRWPDQRGGWGRRGGYAVRQRLRVDRRRDLGGAKPLQRFRAVPRQRIDVGRQRLGRGHSIECVRRRRRGRQWRRRGRERAESGRRHALHRGPGQARRRKRGRR